MNHALQSADTHTSDDKKSIGAEIHPYLWAYNRGSKWSQAIAPGSPLNYSAFGALLGWLKITQPHRNELGYPRLLHGHSEEGISDTHRPLVVGDNQKLGTLR